MIFENLFGGEVDDGKENTLTQFVPQNTAAFACVAIGVIILSISVAFVALRIPNLTLPTAEELDASDVIKKNKPPNPTGLIPVRDVNIPFPTAYPAALASSNDAFNKTDFNNLYNNHIKPKLDESLLNSQQLMFNKSSKTTDVLVSTIFAFIGAILIALGVSFYAKKIQLLMQRLK